MQNAIKGAEGAMFSQSVRDYRAFKGFVSRTKLPALDNCPRTEAEQSATKAKQNNNTSVEMARVERDELEYYEV
jgi:hypothetical protein